MALTFDCTTSSRSSLRYVRSKVTQRDTGVVFANSNAGPHFAVEGHRSSPVRFAREFVLISRFSSSEKTIDTAKANRSFRIRSSISASSGTCFPSSAEPCVWRLAGLLVVRIVGDHLRFLEINHAVVVRIKILEERL